MLENLQLLTKVEFTDLVEQHVRREKMTYIEAVLHICQEKGLDPSDVGKLIGPVVKSHIEAEAQAQNLLPKSNSLSFI